MMNHWINLIDQYIHDIFLCQMIGWPIIPFKVKKDVFSNRRFKIVVLYDNCKLLYSLFGIMIIYRSVIDLLT